jgi:hypothetical protein
MGQFSDLSGRYHSIVNDPMDDVTYPTGDVKQPAEPSIHLGLPLVPVPCMADNTSLYQDVWFQVARAQPIMTRLYPMINPNYIFFTSSSFCK